MLKLLTIMILYFQIGSSQCYDSKYRYSYYTCTEVLNLYTGEYEKFRNTDTTQALIEIDFKNQILYMNDAVNKFSKQFKVLNCMCTDSTVTYDCFDRYKERNCLLIFSYSKTFYYLTVRYGNPPVVYRLNRLK